MHIYAKFPRNTVDLWIRFVPALGKYKRSLANTDNVKSLFFQDPKCYCRREPLFYLLIHALASYFKEIQMKEELIIQCDKCFSHRQSVFQRKIIYFALYDNQLWIIFLSKIRLTVIWCSIYVLQNWKEEYDVGFLLTRRRFYRDQPKVNELLYSKNFIDNITLWYLH